jgi:Ca-activated chloride channel homolog
VYVAGQSGIGLQQGDNESPLQRLLPLAPEEKIENQIPPVAMVLVLDRSGSMQGEKLAWTKRAALGAVEALPPDAQIGLVAFDAEYRWIAPLTQAADRAKLSEEINSLAAGGGTRFFPALQDTYYALGSSNAALKHVVLLTDGLSTDGVDFAPLVAKMHQAGISVSTVAISHEADLPLLRSIAAGSGGRSYYTEKASEVPRIFVDESRLVVKQARVERLVRPSVENFASAIAGIDFAAAPPLRGYIATSTKAGASEILKAEAKHPLLVHWHYGVGQVAAFASETDGQWADLWTAWSSFARLWAQIVHQVLRPSSSSLLALEGRVEDQQLGVTVGVSDPRGRPASDAVLELFASGPEMVARAVPVALDGPGRFRGAIPWPYDGTVVLRARANRGDRFFAATSTVIDRSYPAEFGSLDDDRELLVALARLSGGRIAPWSEIARPSTVTGRERVAIAPWLLCGAVVLLLLDLYFKRVHLRGQ